MSETQRNLFTNRRAGNLWIAGALILLVTLVIVAYFPAPSPLILDPLPAKENPSNALSRLGDQPRSLVRPFQSSALPPYPSDFYRTIIDNNLFRPLGWTPPRPIEPYRLLGTILPTDEKTQPQAIIQAAAGNKTHIVTIGDKLDVDTKVIDIQAKQIRLETAGQQKTLHLKSRFLQRR